MKETLVRWYVGIPDSGKTTLAIDHALGAQHGNRWPVLVLDAEGAGQMAQFERASTVAEALRLVWGDEPRNAVYAPPTVQEANAIGRAAFMVGHVNLILDGAHAWLGARMAVSGPLVRLMRAHRHAPANIFATTHHLTGDTPQTVLSLAPLLYVFRCTAEPVLDFLRRNYGIDPERVRGLEQAHYLRISPGF